MAPVSVRLDSNETAHTIWLTTTCVRCAAGGRAAARNVAAEAAAEVEKIKIAAAEAEAEAEAKAAADKTKKNTVSKKQAAKLDADRVASEAFAHDKTIPTGELRAIRGAAQASSRVTFFI